MKTFIKNIGIFILNVVVNIAYFMPIGGLVFLGIMAIAGCILGLAAIGLPISNFIEMVSTGTLLYCGRIYLGMAIFVLLIMITFTFQNCCIGLNTFRNHIIHTGWRHWESILTALLWPYSIYKMDRSLRSWGSSWIVAVLAVLDLWFFTSWKGTRMEVVDFTEGTSETYFVTPDTVGDQMVASIKKTMDKN